MEFDDWIASEKSTRVWLADSMTALGQFAYVTPIPRVMHYNKHTKGRYECKQENMKSVKHVIKVLTRLVSILMEYISKMVTKTSDIYQRLILVITIFKETSKTSLQRMLTLVRFFGKFNGEK